jgi:hypothetical protein
MEELKEGRGRAGGDPWILTGWAPLPYRRSCERRAMRLEKSKTPLASQARYAARASAAARLLAQAGRPREPHALFKDATIANRDGSPLTGGVHHLPAAAERTTVPKAAGRREASIIDSVLATR